MSAEEVQLPTQSAPLALPCSSPRPQVAAPPLLAATPPLLLAAHLLALLALQLPPLAAKLGAQVKLQDSVHN